MLPSLFDMAGVQLGLGEERVEAGEQRMLKGILDDNLPTLERRNHPVPRAQHPKHHGCVGAKFIVEAGLGDDLRAGVFAEPKTYDALIRFSNGRRQWDCLKDVHGMAIKLLNVPGQKVLSQHENEMTQDFILIDNEVFFSSGLEEYAEFNRIVGSVRKGILGKFRLLRALRLLAKLKRFPGPLPKRLKEIAGKKPTSPLASSYWSTTPYRLGSQAVKYTVWPNPVPAAGGKRWALRNRLGRVLVAHLAAGEARFDFGVHVQTNANRQPIEDPTVSWSANGERPHKLATIVIPRQMVDRKGSRAENLAFSPWHTLEAHRPLGAINRARLQVYEQMAKERHRLNKVSPAGSSEVANP